jgi:tetratricopeptide (TPR) repeat protein
MSLIPPAGRMVFVLGVALMLLVSGCARSPEAKKARYLSRGDAYFQKEQYREAIIEYQNALRIEQGNAHAFKRIGLARFQLGELLQAFRYLSRARELGPDDLEVRLRLGAIYLTGRAFADARQEARFVLDKDPKSLEALVLLADAADSPHETEAALARLEQDRTELGGRPRFLLALGNLYLKKHDLPAAERAFQQAAVADPQAPEAHVLLGQVYLAKRETDRAEQAFKTAADRSPKGSAARIRLADFYFSTGRTDEAKRLLTTMTQDAPDSLTAWRRLADIALTERNYDEGMRAVAAALKKSPADLDSHFLRGRVYLGKRQTTEAIQEFREILRLEPMLAPAHYQLALAHLQAGNVQQAKAELGEATKIAPSYREAIVRLAALNIQSGAVDLAIEDLQKLVARDPMAPAYGLLGDAYLIKRDLAKALAAYRQMAALSPKDHRGPFLVGLALRAQGKPEEARKQLEASLALAPAFVDPLSVLVSLDFSSKKPDTALDRVTRQMALVPGSGGLHELLGRVREARGERGLAEAAYLKSIELDPSQGSPYIDLARIYSTAGKEAQALAEIERGLKVNPKNVGFLMLAGTLYERRGEAQKAQLYYERVLAANPRFTSAANNLAYLYSENGGDMEKALQLAQTAKETAPDDPRVSDTLGWILYKRGVYLRAFALLQESATKIPDNAEVQYHLGMAAYKAGDRELARKALTQAAMSPQVFSGKEDARRTLVELR